MVSLVDLAEMKANVKIRGQDVEVSGVTADTLVRLMTEAPEIRRVLAGKALGEELAQNLLMQGPHIVAVIIAAGCGHGNDEKQIAGAKKLTVGEQAMLLNKIIEVTFPQGLGVFLDGLADLLQNSAPQSAAGPIKEAVTKLRAQSATSQSEDTAPATSGA